MVEVAGRRACTCVAWDRERAAGRQRTCTKLTAQYCDVPGGKHLHPPPGKHHAPQGLTVHRVTSRQFLPHSRTVDVEAHAPPRAPGEKEARAMRAPAVTDRCARRTRAWHPPWRVAPPRDPPVNRSPPSVRQRPWCLAYRETAELCCGSWGCPKARPGRDLEHPAGVLAHAHADPTRSPPSGSRGLECVTCASSSK